MVVKRLTKHESDMHEPPLKRSAVIVADELCSRHFDFIILSAVSSIFALGARVFMLEMDHVYGLAFSSSR